MTDDRSPELRAADDALLAAITERFRIVGAVDTDSVVESFVVAAYVNGMDLMDRNSARYAYAVRDSGEGPYSAPTHELRGLLMMAEEWIADGDD